MSFIKQYWFNILIAIMIICGMGLTIIVSLSPREDKQKRGFIPCTEQLADNITLCNGKIWCASKAIINNSICDAKIIISGVKLWINGKQKTPWSNYIFIPDLSHIDNPLYEESELFYKENPNYLQDFEELKQTHNDLEEKIQDEETAN